MVGVARIVYGEDPREEIRDAQEICISDEGIGFTLLDKAIRKGFRLTVQYKDGTEVPVVFRRDQLSSDEIRALALGSSGKYLLFIYVGTSSDFDSATGEFYRLHASGVPQRKR
jgi:hypothetical protein